MCAFLLQQPSAPTATKKQKPWYFVLITVIYNIVMNIGIYCVCAHIIVSFIIISREVESSGDSAPAAESAKEEEQKASDKNETSPASTATAITITATHQPANEMMPPPS